MCCGSSEDESEMDFCQVTMRRNALELLHQWHVTAAGQAWRRTVAKEARRHSNREEVKTEQSWDELKSPSWCCRLFRNWKSSSAQPATAARAERCPQTLRCFKTFHQKKTHRDPGEGHGRKRKLSTEKIWNKVVQKLAGQLTRRERMSLLLIWSLSFMPLSC